MLRGFNSKRGRGSSTQYEFDGPDGTFVADAVKDGEGYKITVGEKTYSVKLMRGPEPEMLVAEVSGKPVEVTLREVSGQRVDLLLDSEEISYRRKEQTVGPLPRPVIPRISLAKDALVSPMPGRVITIMTKEGESIQTGEPLVVIESMKMEVAIRSDRDANVEKVLVSEGDSVKRGQVLVKFQGQSVSTSA